MEAIETILEEIQKKAEEEDSTSSSVNESNHQCKECQDKGLIIWRDAQGYLMCKKCSCMIVREAEEKINKSGLADVIKTQTFETFETKTAIQLEMKNTALNYLDEILHPKDGPLSWLFISGNPGCGKTHICNALCGELLHHNIAVLYMVWNKVTRTLKSHINALDFDELISDYINTPILYIDDFLKQKYVDDPIFSEAEIKMAFEILNSRYYMNKPTIISTEWDLFQQLLPEDEGVFSRVYERCRDHMVVIPRDIANNYRLNEK